MVGSRGWGTASGRAARDKERNCRHESTLISSSTTSDLPSVPLTFLFLPASASLTSFTILSLTSCPPPCTLTSPSSPFAFQGILTPLLLLLPLPQNPSIISYSTSKPLASRVVSWAD